MGRHSGLPERRRLPRFEKSAARLDFIAKNFTPYHADVLVLDLEQRLERSIAETGGNGFRQFPPFNFKAELDKAARDTVLAAIRGQGKLPGIATMAIGRNVLPHNELSPMEWFVMTQCPSAADNDVFQKSAAHQDFIRTVFAPPMTHSLSSIYCPRVSRCFR